MLIPGSHYYDPQLLDSFTTSTQSYHDTVAGDYSIINRLSFTGCIRFPGKVISTARFFPKWELFTESVTRCSVIAPAIRETLILVNKISFGCDDSALYC